MKETPYTVTDRELQVMFVHDSFWHALADRDIDRRFSYCADEITFIGSGLNEKAANKEEYVAINKKGVDQYPEKFNIKFLWKRISLTGDIAWVETEVEWALQVEDRVEKEMLRNSVVLKNTEGKWLIIHVHGSMPDFRLSGQNYMTTADTFSRNIVLEQQVFHRTKELNQALDDLKATQAQLIQTEKMASLGELTAGIAHEIQNPLNFVNNFSEVNAELIDELQGELAMVRLRSPTDGNLQSAIEIGQSVRENEEKIIFHGKRADAIVKGMLQHSRASSGVKEPTDINALADEYLRLAYHGLRAKDKSFNATITTDFDESIGLINVVPQDIGRVMLNLVMNAFYAVSNSTSLSNIKAPLSPPLPPEGGRQNLPAVTITTRKLLPPIGGKGGGTAGSVMSQREYIEIRIIDNGPGIPAHILDKIFQPFFTTKPTGQGTGLGLSLSYDIVKAHGGELKVETKEGEGSTFILYLPAGSNDFN